MYRPVDKKMPIEITTFKKDYVPDMARLFVQNYRKLRLTVPILPEVMENTERITQMLTELSETCPGVVALNGSKLVGFLGLFNPSSGRCQLNYSSFRFTSARESAFLPRDCRRTSP